MSGGNDGWGIVRWDFAPYTVSTASLGASYPAVVNCSRARNAEVSVVLIKILYSYRTTNIWLNGTRFRKYQVHRHGPISSDVNSVSHILSFLRRP